MPRRSRPREGRAPRERERPLAPEIVTGAPPGWQARAIAAAKATKWYRCPGCEQEIRPGTAHVTAWRLGAESERRHWHRACWERVRRTRPGHR